MVKTLAMKREREPAMRVRVDWVTRSEAVLALKGEKVRAWIEASLEYSGIGIAYERMLEGTTRGLYLVGLVRVDGELRAVLVLESLLIGGPVGKVVSVLIAGGDGMKEWISTLADAVKLAARTVGAQKIVVIGRPGWQRILEAEGLIKTGVVMECKVGGGYGI